MILLFGMITVVGINTLVKSGQDLMTPRNLIIVAVILVCGIGGMKFTAGSFGIEKIGLAGILGIVLNIILPREKTESTLIQPECQAAPDLSAN
jgi:uracil permease